MQSEFILLQITKIVKKPPEDRTTEEKKLLELSPDLTKEVLKRTKHRQLAKERLQEVQ